MRYVVEYFNHRVQDTIESWPVGILADYARLVELLADFGPHLTRTTPQRELDTARKRRKQVLDE